MLLDKWQLRCHNFEMAHATADQIAEVYLTVGPLYRRAQRFVESAPDADDVPMGVRAVLDMLRREGPGTVPDLARRQEISRQYVQRMADLAIERGFVEKAPNPRHQRSSLLALTQQGDEAIRRIAHREQEQLTPVAEELDHEDVDTTLRVLRTMLGKIPT